MVGAPSGNVLLRRAKNRRADDPAASAVLARSFVAGKIANGRHVLRRAAREISAHAAEIDAAADALGHRLRALGVADLLDHIRGLEGEAAAQYFGVFNHLIAAQKDEFGFRGRNRRPPLDPVNALLSYFYTLLRFDAADARTSAEHRLLGAVRDHGITFSCARVRKFN